METIRLGARLRAARKAAGFKTSKTFSKKNKVPMSTYSQHESGARMPDDETLKFYSKIFLVNFDWLKDGKGAPYSSINTAINMLEEELFDLNSFKPISSINQNLLTSILSELISIHASKISNQTSKKIATDTLKIYKAISQRDTSDKNKMKILKHVLNEYKNK